MAARIDEGTHRVHDLPGLAGRLFALYGVTFTGMEELEQWRGTHHLRIRSHPSSDHPTLILQPQH
jgi:hypothetical protein